MKNWITRLMGSADSQAAAADVAAHPDAGAPDAPPDAAQADELYYRWLLGPAGFDAPAETELLILEQVRSLAQNPAVAAELVPRVPELIPKLLRSLRDESVTTGELSRQVAEDVVLVADVLREANSAYYRPITPIKTLDAAIMLLGQNGLRMLLARVAFRPVIRMQDAGFARRAAPLVWNHSEKCAVAASLMAPGLTADIFESCLAGLMQDVGLIVAFRLADRVCQNGKVPKSAAFGAELLARSRALSAVIATHWDFPNDVADAIALAGDPGGSSLAQAVAQGDHIAKLRILIDAGMLSEDDPLVAEGLNSFQRRCLGKLSNLEE
ncbi:HDOD domain-containing protein [Telluria aromaticivorans]|uniref:HDOD domain-containing protein n=1 Tax=Telluria aromaticivorans TaxID=2725995 RepID=A0A7Y2K0N1_9BURK|nr:HDOD domain-containing protein [Telluria aromaticivorans]NNG24502.1 HDOD domain-containing protein [Telluria aromaticivorans]